MQQHQLLAELLTRLEADGFAFGIGKHLQLQQLLQKLPSNLKTNELKTLLAPLFSTNPQEQERFYDLFDQARLALEMVEEEEEELSKPTPIWPLILLAALAVLGVLGSQFLKPLLFKDPFIPPASYQARTVFRNDSISIKPNKLGYPLLESQLFKGGNYGAKAPWGDHQLQEDGSVTYRAQDTVGQQVDTVGIVLTYSLRSDTQFYVISIIEKPIPEPEPERPETQFEKLEPIPIPYPNHREDLLALQLNADTLARNEFLQANLWWIRLLLLTALGWLIWLWVQARERKRRNLIAEIEERDQAPYSWNIELDKAEELRMGMVFQRLLQRFRKRAEDDYMRLDIKKTIKATARNAGQVDFQYVALTKPPEYLLLIDRYSLNDHRAELYNTIYEEFHEQEVYVNRFFYNGDPKLCFNEQYPDGIGLKDLMHQYAESRWLIMGSGYELLSPMRGRLAKWARSLKEIKERAVLTPIPIEKWGRREDQIAKDFQLMPASLLGLYEVLEQWDRLEPRDYQDVLPKVKDAFNQAIRIDGDLVKSLQRYYATRELEWIAACAVYPTLHWDLTLFLGSTLSTREDSLLTSEHLFRLVRLPWFLEGKIPDQAREELLVYLNEQGKEESTRQALREALEQAPKPDKASAAYDDWRMNVIINELMLRPDAKKQKELEAELGRYLEACKEPDFVIFKYLDRPRTRLDLVVPDSWKRYIYHEGRPFFGWKDWTWALPVWLLLSSFIGFYPVKLDVCTDGELVEYEGRQLCLKTDRDQLLFQEQLLKDTIEAGLPKLADKVLENQVGQFRNTKVDVGEVLFDTTKITNSKPAEYNWYIGNEEINSIASSSDLVLDTTPTITFDSPGNYEIILEVSNTHVFIDQFFENIGAGFYNKGISSYNTFLTQVVTDLNPDSTLLQHYEEACQYFQLADKWSPSLNDSEGRICGSALADVTALLYRRDSIEDSSLPPPTSTQEPASTNSNEAQIFQDPKTRKYGLRTSQRKIVVQAQYDEITWVENRLFQAFPAKVVPNPALRGNFYDFYTQLGQKAIISNDELTQVFAPEVLSNNRIAVLNTGTGRTGYRNSNGEQIIGFRYTSAGVFVKSETIVEETLFDQFPSSFVIDTQGRCIEGCPTDYELYRQLTSRTGIPVGVGQAYTQNALMDALADLYDSYEPKEFKLHLVYVGETDRDAARRTTEQIELDFQNQLKKVDGIQISFSLDAERSVSEPNRFYLLDGPNEQRQFNDKGLSEPNLENAPIEIFEKGGRNGLKRGDKIIVEPIYNNIEQDPASGWYKVQLRANPKADLLLGYIDETGAIKIPLEYKELGFLKEGLIRAQREDNYWGYINLQGETVIEYKFIKAADFQNGEAEVRQFDKKGEITFYINPNGACLRDCPAGYTPIYTPPANSSLEPPQTSTPDPSIQIVQEGNFTDSRDGQTYATVTYQIQPENGKAISMRWMAENLNFETDTLSWCYNDSLQYCETYGRLYTWEAATKACPTGWHLPSDAEWRELAKAAGGYYDIIEDKEVKDENAGYKQLIQGGALHFNGLLGGYRTTVGSFRYLGSGGFYWSATERDGGVAYDYYFFGDDQRLSRYDLDKGSGQSVRCLQN